MAKKNKVNEGILRVEEYFIKQVTFDGLCDILDLINFNVVMFIEFEDSEYLDVFGNCPLFPERGGVYRMIVDMTKHEPSVEMVKWED